MDWAVGVTTCVQRRAGPLPRTLASLRAAGFAIDRLFVDGDDDAAGWRTEFGCAVTARHPHVRTYGNWVLGLAELFVRHPQASRYAMFQDDFVCVRNLRVYLDACPHQPQTYLNCYTFPQNAKLARDRGVAAGWFESNQRGKGAVALVFDRAGVMTLLTHQKMVERPLTPGRGLTNVDGGVVNALKTAGYRELCHLPSLVQHTGLQTSMRDFDRRHPPQPLADTFPGEDCDALTLLTAGRTLPGGKVGAAAYDAYPADVRPALVAAWRGELEAIRRAIEGDRARLAAARTAAERQRYAAAIADYGRRLAHVEVNNPPYLTAEFLAGGEGR